MQVQAILGRMSTLLAVIPRDFLQPEYLPPAPQAEAFDREVRRAARSFKSAIMDLAFYGSRMRAGNMFASLGYESEDKYRENLDVPRSTWFKAVRIGEALFDLPLDDLKSISTGNAELLMQIDPALWGDYPWVTEAKQLEVADFAGLVSQRNRKAGNGKEPYAYYRVRVPFSVKGFLEESVEAYRQQNELSTGAQALEFLVADRHDRPTHLARTTEIRRLIRAVVHLFEQRGLKEITEEMYLLKKARRLIDEAREEEISQAGEAAGNQTGQGWQ